MHKWKMIIIIMPNKLRKNGSSYEKLNEIIIIIKLVKCKLVINLPLRLKYY